MLLVFVCVNIDPAKRIEHKLVAIAAFNSGEVFLSSYTSSLRCSSLEDGDAANFQEFSLPVLEALTILGINEPHIKLLRDTAIFCVHHSLKTSINLLKSFINLGVNPKNIFVLGKAYSECEMVVDCIKKLGIYVRPASVPTVLGGFSDVFIQDINNLYAELQKTLKKGVVKNLLILDHGGAALARVPADLLASYRIIGVEKTAAGLKRFSPENLNFPVIAVASSAVKKKLESPLIADQVIRKLISFIPLNNPDIVFGVIGYGAIGKALTDKLVSLGKKVLVYDKQLVFLNCSEKIMKNELALMLEVDYIFGCTGEDVTINCVNELILTNKQKIFISCSSEDVEFLSLLKFFDKNNSLPVKNVFDDIEYKTKNGGSLRVLRGGFPINFDHTGESVPPNEIQLTRALVLASVLQAVKLISVERDSIKVGFYKLDSELQCFIVLEWMKYQLANKFPLDLISQFTDFRWIDDQSGGELIGA